jgi:fructose-1,6-bisphosphatase/inositol monophosphatase family enzyme
VLLAEGRCDAMVEAIVAYHDVAAVKVLVQEAGGIFLTQEDEPLGPSFEAGVISTTASLGPDLKSLLGF